MTLAQQSLSSARRSAGAKAAMFSSAGKDSTMTRDRHGMSDPTDSSVAFGPFRLFPMRRLLTKVGKPVHIGSRAFDILVALVERPGELITKEELFARVWPSTVVEQANLAVQVASLRRALSDGRYVVNIPGRGYRFVAPVNVIHKDVSADPMSVSPPRVERHPRRPTSPNGRAEGCYDPLQMPQQRRVVTIVRSGGTGQTKAALALVEKLLGAHDQGLVVVEVKPFEKS